MDRNGAVPHVDNALFTTARSVDLEGYWPLGTCDLDLGERMRILVVAAVGLVVVLAASQNAQAAKCDCEKEYPAGSYCDWKCVGDQAAAKKKYKKKGKKVKKIRKPKKAPRVN
jgi:hypothetical protein